MKLIFIGLLLAIFSGCSIVNKGVIDQEMAENMAFLVLSQPNEDGQSEQRAYCLTISGKPPSRSLVRRLNGYNIDPVSCPEERRTSVYFNSFEREFFNKIKLGYGYHCGPLCAAEFNCKFRQKTNGDIEFIECDLLSIS